MDAVTGINWSSERYLLRELVGSGGMSQVYRAWDRQLDREVAVKVLHPHLASSADSRKRFSREARAVAKLHHPHILEIFDFSGDSEGAFIVTEFIEGQTLNRFAEETKFGLPQLGALAAHSLCLALEHAHAAGIVHRDLKPDNVMISRHGVLKLMDFGIARILDQGEKMTMTGAMVGSPAFMAPEVIEGGEADARSDLFSLGILCYWLFTGVLPFDAPNTSALLKRVLDTDYRDPRLVQPAISDTLAAVVASLLMRDPAARPGSAQAVRVSLAAALAEDGITEPERELKAFLADPAPYRARFRAILVERLRTRAQAALAEGKLTPAVQLADRVLALEPEDAATRRILDGVSAKRRSAKRLRTALSTAVSALALGAALFAGEALWRSWSAPRPAVAPPAPAALAEPTQSMPEEATVSTAPSETTPAPESPIGKAAASPLAKQQRAARVVRAAPKAALAPAPVDTRLYDQSIKLGSWANLSIDGQPPLLGVVKTTLHLPLGRHLLMFSAPDRQTETREVEINAQNNPEVRLDLKFAPAQLRVAADPADAMVFIDNRPYGSAAHSPFPIALEKDPRPTVHVEVQKKGFRPYQSDVPLQAGELREVRATLQPAGSP